MALRRTKAVFSWCANYLELPLPLGVGWGEGLAMNPKPLTFRFLSEQKRKKNRESFLSACSATYASDCVDNPHGINRRFDVVDSHDVRAVQYGGDCTRDRSMEALIRGGIVEQFPDEGFVRGADDEGKVGELVRQLFQLGN